MCDTNHSNATLSNAQRAHDLAMQCVSGMTKSAETPDLQGIADAYLKAYIFFWDALNDYVRKQSDEIAKEHAHAHGHGHHHHHHHHE